MAVIQITEANWNDEIANETKTVLLDFWAPWCGPCRMMGPIIDEIAEERPDIKVGKVNVDDEAGLAQKFGVMSIPMLVVMKNGEVINASTGAKPKAAVLDFLGE